MKDCGGFPGKAVLERGGEEASGGHRPRPHLDEVKLLGPELLLGAVAPVTLLGYVNEKSQRPLPRGRF